MSRLALKRCFAWKKQFYSYLFIPQVEGHGEASIERELEADHFSKAEKVGRTIFILLEKVRLDTESAELETPHWLKPDDSTAVQDLTCLQTDGVLGLKMK